MKEKLLFHYLHFFNNLIIHQYNIIRQLSIIQNGKTKLDTNFVSKMMQKMFKDSIIF